jgi:hypothetical protein
MRVSATPGPGRRTSTGTIRKPSRSSFPDNAYATRAPHTRSLGNCIRRARNRRSPVESDVGAGLISEMITADDLRFLCGDPVRCREDHLGEWRAQERLEDGGPGQRVLLEPGWRSLKGYSESSNIRRCQYTPNAFLSRDLCSRQHAHLAPRAFGDEPGWSPSATARRSAA